MIERQVLEEDGKVVFNSIQDCTPILEHAKALHNAGVHGSSELKHAASIPIVVVEAYCNNNKISFNEFMTNQAHMKILLNSPDLSGFRIWKGRV